MPDSASWPELPLDAWLPTYQTLHMWTQVVGKVRLALAPELNHWWHCTLYVTRRGLTTSAIPYAAGVKRANWDRRALERSPAAARQAG